MKDPTTFYLKRDEPNKSCLLSLRQIILDQDEEVTETVKYGMPCFTYRGKMFCYLWTDKKTDEPYILFVEGSRMEHPKLEKGRRSRMKIYRVKADEDIPVKEVKQILKDALGFYKDGTIRIK